MGGSVLAVMRFQVRTRRIPAASYVLPQSLLLASLMLWGVAVWAKPAWAADEQPMTVALGLDGQWKLGHECPIRIDFSDQLKSQVRRVDVATIDGDGVPVVYSRQVASGKADHWQTIRIGRLASVLTITAFSDSEQLAEVELATADVAPGLPSGHPTIVGIGSSMGVEALSRANANGSASSLATAVLDSADQMPTSWRDYAFCDLIVIATDDPDFLKSVSSQQWAAIDTWIRRGGGCVLSLGGPAESLPAAVLDWLPGKILSVSKILDPGSIESLVATDQPLQSFDASRMTLERGLVEVSLSDSLGRELPWWTSYAHGQGTVQLVASSLDNSALADWSDRKLLWQRLLQPYLDLGANAESSGGAVGDSSYLGYSDLVGQLRATLDVFPGVEVFTFGQLAVVLIAVIILIGPVDYWISVRWLKRPHLSWYFAGGCLLLVSVGLTWFYESVRPDEIRINTAQIIDIDTTTGQVAGQMWGHVYSGSAQTVDISARAAAGPEVQVSCDWQGLPGRGLGGLMSQLNADRGMPSYRIESSASAMSEILGVGIPAAGTKCVVSTWNDTIPVPDASRLVEIAGVDQLSGVLVNPLDVELKEPALFYHNWYYSLNSRIPPRERVEISYDTIPKDINRRLNRRRIIEDTDVMTPWSPSDRGSLDRLLELMMFYKSASGKSYASLSHRYHPHLDHSNLMRSDQAVLIGRVDVPWVELDVSPRSQASAESAIQQDVTSVWCRFVIPVQPPNK